MEDTIQVAASPSPGDASFDSRKPGMNVSVWDDTLGVAMSEEASMYLLWVGRLTNSEGEEGLRQQ